MRKPRQSSFDFNTDQGVKRVLSDIRKLPGKDLQLLMTAGEHEQSKRANAFHRRDQTKDAIAGFLDKIDFDYFCTFTTRKPVSLYATRRIADRICSRVNAGTTSSVFWAAEEFDVREGFHFHALMKMFDDHKPSGVSKYRATEPFNKMEFFNWYFAKYGRCQLIDNRAPEMRWAASQYISKYVAKKITDYDFRISPYHMK